MFSYCIIEFKFCMSVNYLPCNRVPDGLACMGCPLRVGGRSGKMFWIMRTLLFGFNAAKIRLFFALRNPVRIFIATSLLYLSCILKSVPFCMHISTQD